MNEASLRDRPIIQIRNLSKVYFMGEERVIALKNINLSINRGEICCIFGTSGSGKSTLIQKIKDEETGEVIHGPDMISKGFVFEQQFSHLLEDAKCLVLDHLETSPRLGIPRLGDRIRSSLRSFFRKVVGRDPVVVPVITEV